MWLTVFGILGIAVTAFALGRLGSHVAYIRGFEHGFNEGVHVQLFYNEDCSCEEEPIQ